MKLRYPKFIHGEFMTHRVFSRNASSSRAVPTSKLLEEVRTEALRAAPVWWGKNQPGMQAEAELDDFGEFKDWNLTPKQAAQGIWVNAALEAASFAERLLEIGVHKQIANRLLEPFSHINVVVTSTDWLNFYSLRLDKAAQPEMRALAHAMWEAMFKSTPTLLKPGQWHLPFVDDEDRAAVAQQTSDPTETLTLLRMVSVARNARVSYENFETGKRSTAEEDIKLFQEKLFPAGRAPHASPAEHQATPDVCLGQEIIGYNDNDPKKPQYGPSWKHPEWHGNLKGWCQFRKMIPGENVEGN